MPDVDPEDMGAAIDQLITVDMEQRGVIGDLYGAARDHHGRSPTMLAAERLEAEVSPGDDVLLVTGFPTGPTLVQETDGPVGAASLARAVRRGLGAQPTILVEDRGVHTVEAAARAFGLSVEDYAGKARDPGVKAWTCPVESLPIDREAAEARAEDLLDELDPAALIAIERAGANDRGEYHKAAGDNITDDVAKAEPLFEAADGVTIGIGDGGNELGMGTIRETVREAVPRAEECGCGCGGGLAAALETDVVVPATISNWGAHGIVAALSHLLGEEVLHDGEMEERVLTVNGISGACDGVTGAADGTVDGVSADVHGSFIDLLGSVVGESSVLTETWRNQ